MLGKGVGGWEWVVPEERDDLREAMNPRIRCPGFPVVDGRFVYAKLLSHLLLEEVKVQSALAEMTTDCREGLGIPNR